MTAPYIQFQRSHAEGRTLTIGTGADPAGFGDSVVHFDIDRWRYKYFVQGDAHHLPFKDNSFDTVILADVLEHLTEPLKALEEAYRVAPKLVLTAFEEWRLDGLGQHIERAREIFFPLTHDYDAYPNFVELYPEHSLSHQPHINQFDAEMLQNLIQNAGWRIESWSKVPTGVHESHTMFNWLVIGKR